VSRRSAVSVPGRRALALACLPLALPWSVQSFGAGDVTLRFVWGLVNTAPPTVTPLDRFLLVYTAGLPEYILAWPLAAALYALALGAAGLGVAVGREDPRVTGALFVLAALADLTVVAGFSVQPTRTAYPVGATLCLALALGVYLPTVRACGTRPSS
jgi:uncharacterized protein (TIGR04206 family)